MKRIMLSVVIALTGPSGLLGQTSVVESIRNGLRALLREGTAAEIHAAGQRVGAAAHMPGPQATQVFEAGGACRFRSLSKRTGPAGEIRIDFQVADAGWLTGLMTSLPVSSIAGATELRFQMRETKPGVRHITRIEYDGTIESHVVVDTLSYLTLFLPTDSTAQRQRLQSAVQTYAAACEQLW